MYVIDDRVDAVFVNAGSYVMRPKSSSSTLIWRRSMARTVPSVISMSYVLPVRLSVTVSVSPPFWAAPSRPPVAWVSVLIASPGWGPRRAGVYAVVVVAPPSGEGTGSRGVQRSGYPPHAPATHRAVRR